MGKTMFSLDTYKKKADDEFGQYDIRVSEDVVVVLKNPLRVPAEKRTELFSIVEQLKFDGDTATAEDVARIAPLMLEIMRLVGDENVDKLIDSIGEDLTVTMAIFQDYFKAVGLGEASSSEN